MVSTLIATGVRGSVKRILKEPKFLERTPK